DHSAGCAGGLAASTTSRKICSGGGLCPPPGPTSKVIPTLVSPLLGCGAAKPPRTPAKDKQPMQRSVILRRLDQNLLLPNVMGGRQASQPLQPRRCGEVPTHGS